MQDDQTRERDPITEPIIGAAIEVHRTLGPGLLESAYEVCLCYELEQRGIAVINQAKLPVIYESTKDRHSNATSALTSLFPGNSSSR